MDSAPPCPKMDHIPSGRVSGRLKVLRVGRVSEGNVARLIPWARLGSVCSLLLQEDGRRSPPEGRDYERLMASGWAGLSVLVVSDGSESG